MNITETVNFAYDSLNANKMRAGITMLGMVIGTASIILVVTVALTGREYILQQIQGVGSNLIYLYYEARSTVSGAKTLSDDLTLGDLHAIQELSGVAYATGIVVDHDRLMLGGREREIVVLGTTPDYLRVRNLRILSGRFFDSSDERSFNKVCVLTPALARGLLGSLDVKGRKIGSLQVRFDVIGVFEEGVETFGASEISDYSIIIPHSIMRNFYGTDKLDTIYASATSRNLVPVVTESIRKLLETRHRSGALYRVENLAEILRAAGRIGTALTVVLFLVGTMSLIISGIGIMNIMLFTVTERTREIGLKMAVGARRREILYQFLAESVLMASAGGTAGILLGIAGPVTAKWIADIEIPISWISITLAFGLSLVIGVVSGIVPANRAARSNPIEALRFE
ncbi:MAG TPA: ABC transporter permease [Acidobacteriota bacterium]|nr:ABC transporter permease [Acidobacteriota bacterium]